MYLDLDRLTQALGAYPVGHTIDYHLTVESTMPRARQLAAMAGVRSGTVVVAEEQTAGRGRQQRRWDAPIGSALLTTFLFTAPLPVALAQLPMWVGLAVVRTLLAFAPELTGQVGLKWPNDILLGATRQKAGKVAGILIETSLRSSTEATALVGIGLNVNQTAADLPPAPPGAPFPTSLRLYVQSRRQPEHSSRVPDQGEEPLLDRTALLIQLCRTFSTLVENPPAADALWAAWRDQLWTLDQWVTIRELADAATPTFAGRAVAVTPTGDLVVVDAQGQQRTFAAGDVTVRST